MTKKIAKVTKLSKQDTNALENINYSNRTCEIDFRDLVVNKPWGSEYLLYENSDCAIWILHIKHKHNTSMHCHVHKDTSLVCLEGTIACNTLNDKYILEPLDAVFIQKKVFHQSVAKSKNGAYLLEIETPVNKFDLARIDDTYGRQGKEYEDKKHYTKVVHSTLNLENNSEKQINNTRMKLYKFSTLKDLEQYPSETLIAFLSSLNSLGKVQRLQEINVNEIKPNEIVLIISQDEA